MVMLRLYLVLVVAGLMLPRQDNFATKTERLSVFRGSLLSNNPALKMMSRKIFFAKRSET